MDNAKQIWPYKFSADIISIVLYMAKNSNTESYSSGVIDNNTIHTTVPWTAKFKKVT